MSGVINHLGPAERQPGHLRKRINVSLIVGLLAQAAAAIWWVSDFNAWRHEAERQLARHDQALVEGEHRAEDTERELADRLGRIETLLAAIQKQLDQTRR